MSSHTAPVLIAGAWRTDENLVTFQAENPSTGEFLPERFPVSTRDQVKQMLQAGSEASAALWHASGNQIAEFLENYAAAIETHAAELVELAHAETGLPKSPRLKEAELPRTTDQLLQAAAAARSGSWRRPIRDDARKIYSCFGPLGGPVVVMGPNNFPFAFNSAAGGDFAAAIAAHNPVIAKANTGHPGTTRLFAELAFGAVQQAGLHPATIQLCYRIPGELGFALVSDPLVGATAFTGSKEAGVKLKLAADAAGKPIYLEMSSVNPVILLEGAVRERGEKIAEEFLGSCTMGAGQFCTNPGFVVVPESEAGMAFIVEAQRRFEGAQGGVLLNRGVRDNLTESVTILQKAGAKLLCGGVSLPGPAFRFANTLLSVSGDVFLKHPHELQTEAFGPVALLVTSRNSEQTIAILRQLEGNLTGTVYSDTAGSDDTNYAQIEPDLRRRVGRLLNDKMPTGVAVSPAMNHGGPYPATGHPGFTAVGLPASIQRFTALLSYDNVRPHRLPAGLAISN
jgi:alpha-ketoglutaric semialdehyde dehydrogenase